MTERPEVAELRRALDALLVEAHRLRAALGTDGTGDGTMVPALVPSRVPIPPAPAMPSPSMIPAVRLEGTWLKVLLRERHWQSYGQFCREWAKHARRIDGQFPTAEPSRAQYHRWMDGALKRMPHGRNCEVLELMFPGWRAEQLFALATSEEQAA